MIDDDFAVTTLNEGLFEFLDGGRVFDGIHLRTGHHTVAHLRLGEIKGILEDLHLLTDLVFIFGVVNTGLYKVIEVNFCEFALLRLFRHTDAHQPEEPFGEESGQTGDRIEDDITDIGRDSEDGKHGVGSVLEDGLRQELACKEDNDGRKQGIKCDTDTIAEGVEQRSIEDTGKKNTVYNQGDVIAHEHGRNKIVRMLIEDSDGLLGKTILLTVHLCQETVARDKGDLHAREECGEQHRYQ